MTTNDKWFFPLFIYYFLSLMMIIKFNLRLSILPTCWQNPNTCPSLLNSKPQIQCQLNIAIYLNSSNLNHNLPKTWSKMSTLNLHDCNYIWHDKMFSQLLRLDLESTLTLPNASTKPWALSPKFISHSSTTPLLTTWANVPPSYMLFVELALKQVIQVPPLLLSLLLTLNSEATEKLLKCKSYHVSSLLKTSNGVPTHSE